MAFESRDKRKGKEASAAQNRAILSEYDDNGEYLYGT